MAISLRDYQQEAFGNIQREFRHARRVLYEAPTGSGKTRVFSRIVEAAAQKDKRILIRAHRRTVIGQIHRTLNEFGLRHGLILPGHTMTNDLIQVGMVQTIDRRLDRIAKPDRIITDECHHRVTDQYQRTNDAFPEAFELGLTASPERLDGKGLRASYDVMVPGPKMRWLIENKYLADYEYFKPPSVADLSHLHTSYGDFNIAEQAAAMNRSVITGNAIEHWFAHGRGRPTVAFCVNVRHAEDVAAEFRAAGVRAYSIDGKMSPQKQDALLKALADGTVTVVTSCALISEGTDVPAVAVAILLQLTQSRAKQLQNVGRVLRAKADGGIATILDHVGNFDIHGAPDTEYPWSLDGRDKKAAVPENRTCLTCYRTFGAAQPVNCDFGAMCGLAPASMLLPTTLPETIAGNLVKVDSTWQRGWALDEPGTYALHELETLAAGDPAKLKAIAKARGYHHRWAVYAARRWSDRLRQAAE